MLFLTEKKHSLWLLEGGRENIVQKRLYNFLQAIFSVLAYISPRDSVSIQPRICISVFCILFSHTPALLSLEYVFSRVHYWYIQDKLKSLPTGMRLILGQFYESSQKVQ